MQRGSRDRWIGTDLGGDNHTVLEGTARNSAGKGEEKLQINSVKTIINSANIRTVYLPPDPLG
jgi:hypothetical protein